MIMCQAPRSHYHWLNIAFGVILGFTQKKGFTCLSGWSWSPPTPTPNGEKRQELVAGEEALQDPWQATDERSSLAVVMKPLGDKEPNLRNVRKQPGSGV